jgi:hypothetical protein
VVIFKERVRGRGRRRLAWLAAGAVAAVGARRRFARARTRRALWDGSYWRGRTLPVRIRRRRPVTARSQFHDHE